ncbi:MAG: hydroxysqualene dehydroxylase HpnE [Rhodospirillaceae bacterium]|nr:hydroxysqualene dehydroxylase HpnE [Rhodospirillaceae bacterium]
MTSDTASRAWVIGAGLAGLSAAVRLAGLGWSVTVFEAAGQPGGRCRSFHDSALDRTIDNGNHLLLSGNRSAMGLLRDTGAPDPLIEVAPARIPFVDLGSGARWTLRPNRGPLPWWVCAPGRRVPDTGLADYAAALKLRRAGDRTVAELFDGPPGSARHRLYERFWEPMAVAVLNTEAAAGAARLLWPVMAEILLRGETAFRPCIARTGLSESFADPAVTWLEARGGRFRPGVRIRSVSFGDAAVSALNAGGEAVAVAPGEPVVSAVPPAACNALFPDVATPAEYRPIVNLHYVVGEGVALPGGLPLLGLIGGTAQWLFLRGDVLSVTISAGVAEAALPHDRLAGTVWEDIRRAAGAAGPMPSGPVPPCRVITEKRATIAQTPAQDRLRPGATTRWRNLYLAGDWTDTGLPATIEGAIRSGETAANAIGRPPAAEATP